MARTMLEKDYNITYFCNDKLNELVNKVFESKWNHVSHREALKELMEECYMLGFESGKDSGYDEGYEDASDRRI